MSDVQRISIVDDDLDAELDGIVNDVGPSPLEALRERVSQTQAERDVTWAVPGRQGLQVRYTLSITPRQQQALLNKCRLKDGTVDNDKYHALILGTFNTGIFIDDLPVEDDGKVLTLHDRAILELFGAKSVADAVRRCYGATDEDPNGYRFNLQSHVNRLLIAAGFAGPDEEDEEEDDDEVPPDS